MTITQPQRRSRTTQLAILKAYAARLQQHEQLNVRNCFVTDQPVPLQMPTGGFIVTVAPMGGRFDNRLWDGAGHATLSEDGTVVVSIFLQNVQEVIKNQSALIGESETRLSLMSWKRDLLKILLVDIPTAAERSQVWEPEIEGRPLLRQPPTPISVSGVSDVPGHVGWIGLQITFSVKWDWDLYE